LLQQQRKASTIDNLSFHRFYARFTTLIAIDSAAAVLVNIDS